MFEFKLYSSTHYLILAFITLLFCCSFLIFYKYWKRNIKKLLFLGVGAFFFSVLITLFFRITFFPGGGLYDPLYKDTQVQITYLQKQLSAFKKDCGRFPTTDEGLMLLKEKPKHVECPHYNKNGYLINEIIPEDPYGNQFRYESDGLSYELYSKDEHFELKILGTDKKKPELIKENN